jgi:hypothetical protein
MQSAHHLASLSNDELVASLQRLVHDEHRLVADLIEHLLEVEERRVHLEMAFPSMYAYCRDGLGWSEGQTHRKLTAARLVKRFPSLLDAIRDGRIHLSNLALLRDRFTADNVEKLVATLGRKSKRDLERAVAEPVDHGNETLTLTITPALREKIERARALTRHRNPNGDLTVILERALDLLVDKLEREKLGKTSRPRDATDEATSTSTSRPASTQQGYIPRAVRRAALARDGFQCTFVSDDGVRCPARELLELDHRIPRARGGKGDLENVRGGCRAHNRLAAEHVFGRAHVDAQIDLRRRRCGASTSTNLPSAASTMSAATDTAVQTRKQLYGALVTLGFRASEASRALADFAPADFAHPVEELLRGALRILTPD